MSKGSSTAPRVEGQLMIRFKDSVDPARAREILEQAGAEILTTYSDARMFHIGLPAQMSVEQGIEHFSAFEELDFVEPNQVYTTQESKE